LKSVKLPLTFYGLQQVEYRIPSAQIPNAFGTKFIIKSSLFILSLNKLFSAGTASETCAKAQN